MPFLTNDPLPQCLQHNSATGGLLGRDHARGCRRYLLKVKCLRLERGDQGFQHGPPPSGKAEPLAGQVTELESLISCVTPDLAHCWAERGADLRIEAPG